MVRRPKSARAFSVSRRKLPSHRSTRAACPASTFRAAARMMVFCTTSRIRAGMEARAGPPCRFLPPDESRNGSGPAARGWINETPAHAKPRVGHVDDRSHGGRADPDDQFAGSDCARLDRHPLEQSDRKSTRLNSSHSQISYAVFCLKKKKKKK